MPGKYPSDFLLGVLRVLLIGSNKLVVKVKVDAVAWVQLACDIQTLEKKVVQLVASIEGVVATIIALI